MKKTPRQIYNIQTNFIKYLKQYKPGIGRLDAVNIGTREFGLTFRQALDAVNDMGENNV